MPSYRIGQAAELLGVSVDTLRRWVDSGRLAAIRTEGGQPPHRRGRAGPLATEIVEERDPDVIVGRSARNRFPGIVTRVVKDTVDRPGRDPGRSPPGRVAHDPGGGRRARASPPG